ncbi:MAG: hypothetical protein Q7O12_01180 [Deltaproteobacteria bacterium]|nr:hypothetical protein [Deltaproteobacteria bacterium]
MTKIIRLNREKEAIEAALHALQELPVKQIVVCAEFAVGDCEFKDLVRCLAEGSIGLNLN